MTADEKQRQLVEQFSIIPDRHERLAAVVERARKLPALAPGEKAAAHRVPGCVSPVWIAADLREGRFSIRSDADSPVVKGLISLLCAVYDGATPAETLAVEPTLFDELELTRDLSPTRKNGLAAARARLRELARQALSPP